jgi:hypothetical protein
MAMHGEKTRTGGCQCGALRFEVRGDPRRISACHCRMCQRAVGAPFGIYAVFAPEQVTWTTARDRARWASSNVAARGFCSDCGTPLTYEANDGKTIDILSAVFDDPTDLGPNVAIGVEGKLPWTDGLASLPGRTPTETSTVGGVAIVSNQWADRHT